MILIFQNDEISTNLKIIAPFPPLYKLMVSTTFKFLKLIISKNFKEKLKQKKEQILDYQLEQQLKYMNPSLWVCFGSAYQ